MANGESNSFTIDSLLHDLEHDTELIFSDDDASISEHKENDRTPYSVNDSLINMSPYNNNNWIAGSASPLTTRLYESGMMNSVHMEVQENAKVPTFLETVDRSNSNNGKDNTLRLQFMQAAKNKPLETNNAETKHSTMDDMNLSEIFLGGRHRANLVNNIGPNKNDKIIIDTPSNQNMETFNDKKSPQPLLSPPLPSSSNRPHLQTYYPYDRRIQLPITCAAAPSPGAGIDPPRTSPTSTSNTLRTALPILPKLTTNVVPSVNLRSIALATAAEIAKIQKHHTSPTNASKSANSLHPKSSLQINTSVNYNNKEVEITPFIKKLKDDSTNSETSLSVNNLEQKMPSVPIETSKIVYSNQYQPDPTHTPPSEKETSQSSIQKLPQQHHEYQQNIQPHYGYPHHTSYQGYHLPIQQHQNYPGASMHHPYDTMHQHQIPYFPSQPFIQGGGGVPQSHPPSVMDAMRQQNQFGFGVNHVVPSVPPHHPTKLISKDKVTALSPPQTVIAPATITTTANRDIIAPADENKKMHPPQQGNVVTYERKKQRAKDNRIRFNESIDSLSIAISLAATQSKTRKDFYSPGTLQDKTILAMSDSINTAMQAKKWDRPSLVGTAATLIQNLNSQCEALFRELQARETKTQSFTKFRKEITTIVSEEDKDTSPKRKSIDDVDHKSISQSAPKRGRISQPAIGKMNLSPPSKSSLKLKKDYFSIIFEYGPVLKTFVSFLDPKSLIHCMQVTKCWNNIEEFRNDRIWDDLSRLRFGSKNVELWEKENHHTKVNKIIMYYKMEADNIAPYSSFEANVKLGNAKIDGVKCWASMVERSNGETLRSVQQFVPKSRRQMGGQFFTQPIVEMRIIVQNTGNESEAIVVPHQIVTVDASTRRRGEEMLEVISDRRLKKEVVTLDGDCCPPNELQETSEMLRLRLFETAVLVVHIHARGCSTSSKFQARAKFTKLLVNVNGITVPLVIPFSR